MNEIVVLINNVVLIGNTAEVDNGILIQKPYSVQRVAEGFQIQPFLEVHTGQEWSEIEIKNEHVLASTKADNNELLQAYLQKISGIDVSHPEIILG